MRSIYTRASRRYSPIASETPKTCVGQTAGTEPLVNCVTSPCLSGGRTKAKILRLTYPPSPMAQELWSSESEAGLKELIECIWGVDEDG